MKGIKEAFIDAGEISRMLGIGMTKAYAIIKEYNAELEAKGYFTMRGKCPRKYFEQKIYGYEDYYNPDYEPQRNRSKVAEEMDYEAAGGDSVISEQDEVDFKYLMKRLGYVFKKDAWMEVQAPGFRYYHSLVKMDEMFAEDRLRHHVDMPWMSKPHFYSSDIRGLHKAKLSPYQKRFFAKLYRLRIVEQKRFVVGGAKYTEDLKRFHQLQDEYLLLVNNDIRDVVGLIDFRSEQKDKIQRIDDRQQEIYRESSSRKRRIKTEAQYKEYQMWHVEVQEELDKLKQEKREIKRQLQLADGIMKEDLYTAYYAVSGNEEIVADREIEIPRMEEKTAVEEGAAVVDEPDANVEVMNSEMECYIPHQNPSNNLDAFFEQYFL